MSLSVSIVIPTYLRPDKLEECLASVIAHTDLDNCQVIVVANGAPEETAHICARFPVHLIWHDEPLGYAKAANIGIQATDSEYVVLLNDDCKITGAQWLPMLLEPFSNPRVGITGAQRLTDRFSGHEFLIFFCVMIRRNVFDDIGLLEEEGGSYGEDIAFCIEASHRGWEWRQVPNENSRLVERDGRALWANEFPCFHEAEATVNQIEGWSETVERNGARLRDRYAVDVERARSIEGWMGDDELRHLAAAAKRAKVFVEIGSWAGRSSRVIADNLPDGGILYCVDTWCDDETAADDDVYLRFMANLGDHVKTGRVIPLRSDSVRAAATLRAIGVTADCVFIDGRHDYESVREDIAAWLPLVRTGGVLCGHDYGVRDGVTCAVDEALDAHVARKTTIWRTIVHREASDFIRSVKAKFPERFTGKKVLEVGSLNINGSVREMFTNCDYTGIDLAEGDGVDVVSRAHEFTYPESFDVVISSEMLEHDEHWERSLPQMYDNLKPGGLMVITCAGPKRAEHGTKRTDSGWASPFTSDYYRNISREDFQSVLPPHFWVDAEWSYRDGGEDLYFYGIKRGAARRRSTVTVVVPTKDRYTTTLPMTLSALTTQTRLPDRVAIYDDGEQKNLRELAPFSGILRVFDDLGIQFTTYTTPRLGLAANQQHALDNAETDYVLRVDDDLVLEPNVIETLIEAAGSAEDIGAVAPLVHHPGAVQPLPAHVTGKLEDVFNGVNMQWYQFNSGPREVEHLYSCYLYRVEAARKGGGYPTGLSAVSHREDTWFSMKIAEAGYKLLVTPHCRAWHYRESTGGIRSFTNHKLWEQDDALFREYLKQRGVGTAETKMVVLDCGLGDTLVFKGIFPELRRKHPNRHWTIAACFPQVFEDVPDVKVISIAEAKAATNGNYNDHSIYAWMWKHDWKRSIADAMLEFYGT